MTTDAAATTAADPTSTVSPATDGALEAGRGTGDQHDSPAADAALKGQSREANKAAMLAKFASKVNEPSHDAEGSPDAATGAAATAPESQQSAAKVPDAKPVETDEDREAARLNQIAKEARAVARAREQLRKEKAEREAAWSAREAAAAAERERIAKLDAARSKNSPLAVLRAAGYTDDQIMGSLPVDLLNEMELEARGKPAPEPLTEERARALIAEQQRLDKEAADRARQEAEAANLKIQRDAYFAGVEQEFGTGRFARVAAVAPSHRELDDYFQAYGKQHGVWLSPAQLLEHFEKAYESRGITVAGKPKPSAAPKKSPRATTNTISARATSDAGDLVAEPAKKPRTIAEIHREGKQRALAAIEARRAANGR